MSLYFYADVERKRVINYGYTIRRDPCQEGYGC